MFKVILSYIVSSRSIWAIWDPISENKTKNIKVTIAYSWRNVAYAKSLRLDFIFVKRRYGEEETEKLWTWQEKCKKNVTSGGLENSRGYVWVTHFWSNFCCTPEGNIKLGYFFYCEYLLCLYLKAKLCLTFLFLYLSPVSEISFWNMNRSIMVLQVDSNVLVFFIAC